MLSQPSFMALPLRMLKTPRKYQWQILKYLSMMPHQSTHLSNKTQLSSLTCHTCVKAYRRLTAWCQLHQRSDQIQKVSDLCHVILKTQHKATPESTHVLNQTTQRRTQLPLDLTCEWTSMVMLARTYTSYVRSYSRLTASSQIVVNLRSESIRSVTVTHHTTIWNQDHV